MREITGHDPFENIKPPDKGDLKRMLESGGFQKFPKAIPTDLLKDRLTVVETVYFQPVEGEGAATETRFSRWLKSRDEQPCMRSYRGKQVATQDWVLLEGLWVEHCGQLVITNDEGKGLLVNPSAEEQELISHRVLEVGLFHPVTPNTPLAFAIIPPGESARFYPANLAGLRLRCREGTARYTVAAYPE